MSAKKHNYFLKKQILELKPQKRVLKMSEERNSTLKDRWLGIIQTKEQRKISD